jgi:hypothetical protein
MVVAMVAMLPMQPPVDEIIDMVAVRYRLVPAIGSMDMALVALGRPSFRAAVGVRIAYVDPMLVDMAVVRVVEMTIVQIVRMPVMAHSHMAAIRPVLMGMVPMRLMLCSHIFSPLMFIRSTKGESAAFRLTRSGQDERAFP